MSSLATTAFDPAIGAGEAAAAAVLMPAAPPPAAPEPAPAPSATAAPRATRLTTDELALAAQRARTRALLARVLAPLAGLLVFGLLWHAVALFNGQFPGPLAVWDAAVAVFADPFYSKGPNDQGVGWNVLASLGRVGLGFGLAAAVGIPLGFVIGRFAFAGQMAAPVIALLRPVSPLAWLPIGLLLFKAANPAAIWTIFICSLWPMVINTALGVRQVPQDYLNVAKVLKLSEWKVFTKILFPAVLPYLLTGVRLSVGIAWLVIVAAEMLTGGVGIGFWLWDEWNNLNVANILVAILVIGVVGMALEALLVWIGRRFEYA